MNQNTYTMYSCARGEGHSRCCLTHSSRKLKEGAKTLNRDAFCHHSRHARGETRSIHTLEVAGLVGLTAASHDVEEEKGKAEEKEEQGNAEEEQKVEEGISHALCACCEAPADFAAAAAAKTLNEGKRLSREKSACSSSAATESAGPAAAGGRNEDETHWPARLRELGRHSTSDAAGQLSSRRTAFSAAARPWQRQLCVCMVSDFFYPSLGGIETHIYNLSQCLMQRGYKVFVVTHYAGPSRHGVRYMLNGLKVYYLPYRPFFENAIFPTGFSFFPLVRNILLRERADIVHGHQATSTLAHETMLVARTLGIATVYTDHSLFGFSDLGSIHLNKIVRFCLHDARACICVSHTHRENFVLRVGLPPSRVHVINNAIDPKSVYPDPSKRPSPPLIRIIVLSRLTYRKGIDLLVHIIPLACKRLPHVQFVIGGDGPKRIILEEMREQHRLYDRVQLLGTVFGTGVRELLQSGHIFLNTSLTESFCIAIVEAAACGLLVVSTNVGGIPEVLPPHMVLLAEPDPLAVTKQVEEAVAAVQHVDPFSFHQQVQRMYSWQDVAARTERVYFSMLFPGLPHPPCSNGRGTQCEVGNLLACAPACKCLQQQKGQLPLCRCCTGSRCAKDLYEEEDHERNSTEEKLAVQDIPNRVGRTLNADVSSTPLDDDDSAGSSGRQKKSWCCGCGEESKCCRSNTSKETVRCPSCSSKTSCERPRASEERSSSPERDSGRGSDSSGEQSETSYEIDEEERCYCACCSRPPLCCGCLELPPSPPPLPSAGAVVQRLQSAYKLGPVSGKIFCIIIIIGWIYIWLLEFFFPREEIEVAPTFPSGLLFQVSHFFSHKSKRRENTRQKDKRSVAGENKSATEGTHDGYPVACNDGVTVDHQPCRSNFRNLGTAREKQCCRGSANVGPATVD